MNNQNLDENLTSYHLIYVRNILINKMSLLEMTTHGESLRLNCKKIKHFGKLFTNSSLPFLHERYTYRTLFLL